MNEVGFTAKLKVEAKIEGKKALDEWLIVLDNLAKEASKNFENILIMDRTEEELEKNVIEGNQKNIKIKKLMDYIEDYAVLNGIDLKQYVKQKHSKLTYVQNVFFINKVKEKEQNQK